MSKRAVFTNVTALPSGISRETVMSTFYSHTDIIDLQPMVQSRVPCKPPPKASPEESTAAWYELIDKVHYLPGGLYSGKVKYYVCFHDLADGIQTHVYAPAGLEIKAKWTLGGSLPGELRGPTELGLGLPKEGLYVREDVDMKCNFMLISFVKKNMQKAHKTLVDRLIEKSHTKERDVYNQRLTIGNPAQVQPSTTNYPLPMASHSIGSSGSSTSGAAPGRSSMMSNNSSENNSYASTSFNVAEIDGRTLEITPANDPSSSSSTYNRDSKHMYEYDGGEVHPAMRPQSSEPPPPMYQPPAQHSPYHQQGQFPPQQPYSQEQQNGGYGEYAQFAPPPLRPHSHPQTMQYPPQQYPTGYMQQQQQQQHQSQQHQHHNSSSSSGNYGYGHVRNHSQGQQQSSQPSQQPQYAYQWGGMQISPDQMQKQQAQYAQYQHEQQQQHQNQPQYHNQPQHQQYQQEQPHTQQSQQSQSQLLSSHTYQPPRSRPSSTTGSRTQSPQQRYESAWLSYGQMDSAVKSDDQSTVPGVKKKDGDAELPG